MAGSASPRTGALRTGSPLHSRRSTIFVLETEREYYEDVADSYQGERHGSYDDFVEDMRGDLLRRYVIDRDVLEVGVGRGRRLHRLAPLARRAAGVSVPGENPPTIEDDRSELVRSAATQLPFDDNAFEVVYSFNLLPFLESPQRAIREMARVTTSGGHVFAEFYNPLSLRYLGHRVRGLWGRLFERGAADEAEAAGWHTYRQIARIVPSSVELESFAGLRIWTPFRAIHDVPYVRFFVRKVEFAARESPLKYTAGYLVAVLRRLPDD